MTSICDLDLSPCRLPADRAATLPPVCYTSPDIAEEETDKLFRQGWIGVGRSDLVPEPGTYRTLDIAGRSVILLRDGDGTLQAFANSCRHRGARLVDGAGRCKGLRCPFHSWFYGLDGRLVAAPHMEKAQGFKTADFGLATYPAQERFGFVFISLDPEVRALDEQLGDFGSIHASWPLDRLFTVRRLETEVECNWKSFLEVFNEYYHLPYVHPDSINSLYGAPEPADAVTGAFATQFGPTEGTGALLEGMQEHSLPAIPGLQGRAVSGTRYTWVFPNMTFAANVDSLWSYEAYPLGPGRCKVVQSACFPPESIALPDFEEKVVAYLARLDAALDEDVVALVNQQRGLEGADTGPGRFQPDLEPNVAAFARWYAGKFPVETGWTRGDRALQSAL